MTEKKIAEYLHGRGEIPEEWRTELIVQSSKRKGDVHDPGKIQRHHVAKTIC